MSERTSDASQVTLPGKFRTQVNLRHDVWYGERLVELLAQGEPGMRGGKPKRVQVLMTPEDAHNLAEALLSVVSEACAKDAS